MTTRPLLARSFTFDVIRPAFYAGRYTATAEPGQTKAEAAVRKLAAMVAARFTTPVIDGRNKNKRAPGYRYLWRADIGGEPFAFYVAD